MVDSDTNGVGNENNDAKDKSSLSGLNFRDLVHSIENQNTQPSDVQQDNLYMAQNFNSPNLGDGYTAPQDPNGGGKLSSISGKWSRFVDRVFILSFLRDFYQYIATRSRVLLVLASISVELLSTQVEILKKTVIKKMFWGRGNLFNFSVKFFVFFLVVLILLSGVYRGRTIETGYQIASAAVDTTEKQKYQGDIVVQGSSTKTQFNENANRYDVIIYTVKGGDTLSTIASNPKHNVSVQTILWANNMGESDIIKPGMKLRIPPGDGVLIKIKEGDTLETLADKYKTNPQNILDANDDKLEPPYTLAVGETLFLPNGKMPEPPKPKPTPIAQAPAYSGVVSGGGASTGTPSDLTAGGRFLGWPVSGGGRLTQCYSGWHNGIDIADKSYPTIVAAAPGTVSFAGCQSGSCPALGSYGVGGWGLAWSVMVDHGNGFTTIYAHLNDIYVSSGQSVSTGQAIGQMGQTGLAYGVHVHFMLVRSGTWTSYNPARYMTTSICGY